MELLLDDISSNANANAAEEKQGAASSSSAAAAAGSAATKEVAGKGAKAAARSLPVSPPGSALLASHLHQLPPLCKLYLLHFVCDYVLGEVDILKECCTHSNLLAHGLAPPAAADGDDAAPMVIAPNPFHNHGLSVPHAKGDDGVNYWCFVHDEMSRVHLWRDVQTGARDEFHVRLRKKGSTAPLKPPLVHGNEPEDLGDWNNDDDDLDLADEDDLEPIDAAHAQPTFNFSLIATDLDSVAALVAVWALTWKSPQGLLFLHKLQNEVLPAALIMQKKAERLARRDKTARTAGGLIVPDFGGASAQRWSSRTRKQVNYSEMDSGHDHEPAYRDDDDEEEEEAQPMPHSKRTRRNTVLTPLPDEEIPQQLASGSGSGRHSGAGHTQPASAAPATQQTQELMQPAVASPPAPAAAAVPYSQPASSPFASGPNGSPAAAAAAAASMQESMLAAMYWQQQQHQAAQLMQQQAQAQAQAAAAAAAAAQIAHTQQAAAPMQDASMAVAPAAAAAPAPAAMETDATPAVAPTATVAQ